MSDVVEPAWELPDPFFIDLEVSEAEIDGLGHTNNVVYLAWCDRVAWAHSAAVGLGLEEWQRLDRAMALVRSEIQFLSPSFRGDRIRAGNWVVHWDGRLRATRRFQICRLDDGVTLARAYLQYVCIEITSGRPRRVPELFRQRYRIEPSVAEALRVESSPFALRD